MIDVNDIEFLGDVKNEMDTTIRDLIENEISSSKDTILDAISREAMNAASEIATEIIKKYPHVEQSVSEDMIYEELQGKIEDEFINNLRY